MSKTLLGALPIYAQHLSEATGVKVVVTGQGAYTDGETVVVPFVKNGDAMLTFGFLAHECSHVRNTDMQMFEDAAPTPMRKNLLNILEDIRIERLSMDQYPGTEDDIRHMNRKVLLEPFMPDNVANAEPLHIIHSAVLFGAYWKLQEPQLETPALAYLAALTDLVGQSLADEIMATACRTLQCASTREVLALVDEILEMLPSQEEQDSAPGESKDKPDAGQKQDQDSQPQPGSTEPDEGGDQGQAGSQPGSDQGNNSGSESDSDKNGSNQQPSSSDKGAGDSPGEGQQGDAKDGNGNSVPDLKSMAMNATEEDLKGLISDVGDAAGQLLGTEAARSGVEQAFALTGRTATRSELRASRSIARGQDQSAGLRQVLGGLLQSQVDCRVRLKRQGLKLDGSRIAMLRAGESRVFRSKTRATRQSASIQFLLDKSTSMDKDIVEAEAALYAVLAALEGLPLVSTGAISFPEAGKSCSLIKGHNERLSAAVLAGGFGGTTNGYTPLGAALWPAAVEMLTSKQAKSDRKILFVITDGIADDAYHARDMVKRLEASGVQVIGLGFGQATDDVLRVVFSQYRIVGSVNRLRASLFELARGVLAA
jgi:cobaltochelatase CobT